MCYASAVDGLAGDQDASRVPLTIIAVLLMMMMMRMS